MSDVKWFLFFWVSCRKSFYSISLKVGRGWGNNAAKRVKYTAAYNRWKNISTLTMFNAKKGYRGCVCVCVCVLLWWVGVEGLNLISCLNGYEICWRLKSENIEKGFYIIQLCNLKQISDYNNFCCCFLAYFIHMLVCVWNFVAAAVVIIITCNMILLLLLLLNHILMG